VLCLWRIATLLEAQSSAISTPGYPHKIARSPKKPLLDQLQITAQPEIPPKSTPEIFVSYAWGDDSSEDAKKHTEVVDRLCETFAKDGWHILRDKTDMRPGDLAQWASKR
jgi:hypothetical protein